MAKKNKRTELSFGVRLILSFLMFPVGMVCTLGCILEMYQEWMQVQFSYMLAEKGATSQATILSCEDKEHFRIISYEFAVVRRPRPPYKVTIVNEEVSCFKHGGCSCVTMGKNVGVNYLRENPQQALLKADHIYRAKIVDAAGFCFFGLLMIFPLFSNIGEWWLERRAK